MATNNKYDDSTIKRVWEVQLEILDLIDKLCAENDIKYSICFGTLLGAVRHKGFIPWDDDLDVWMTRENYDKFAQLMNENPIEGFIFQDRYNSNYNHRLGKVRKCDTAFVSETELDANYHHGIFVDVFPLENRCNNPIGAFIQGVCGLLHLQYSRGYVAKTQGNLLNLGSWLFFNAVPKRFHSALGRFFDRQVRKYNRPDYKAKNVATFCRVLSCFFVKYDKHIIENTHSILFAGHRCQCVVDSDHVLTTDYGDYMQLPPEEERVWKHQPAIIDFEKEYWPEQPRTRRNIPEEHTFEDFN